MADEIRFMGLSVSDVDRLQREHAAMKRALHVIALGEFPAMEPPKYRAARRVALNALRGSRMMCTHEIIQLSQDGERVIYCADCGREFAKVAQDENETLVVPVPRGSGVVLLDGCPIEETRAGVAYANMGGEMKPQPVYPCARCGWSGSCPEVHGEDCHT